MAPHNLIVITIIKLKEISIHATPCFLGQNQHNNSVSNSALLDLVFANINDLCIPVSNYPVVAPDNYQPPRNLNFKLAFDCQPTFLTPRRNYGHEDYLLLYNTSYSCDWSRILNENSVHSAVYNFTVSVAKAINDTIPSVKP
jgi:hypothetical protein